MPEEPVKPNRPVPPPPPAFTEPPKSPASAPEPPPAVFAPLPPPTPASGPPTPLVAAPEPLPDPVPAPTPVKSGPDWKQIKLPMHAREELRDLPWDKVEWVTEGFEGMLYGGLHRFAEDDYTKIIVWTSDADDDTDGPGGSTAIDPWWQPHTTLRYPDGSSCNSREFPGIVIPPHLRYAFGVRMGDFGFIIWRGQKFPAQVYDSGPTRKIGEVSQYLARQAGIIPEELSDHRAAIGAYEAEDVVYVLFRGSGNGYAMHRDNIAVNANMFFRQTVERAGSGGSLMA